jgi:flagellar biosynthesis/type III secretory pathway protein FliH
MTDKKLDELIEEYGKLCFRFGVWPEESEAWKNSEHNKTVIKAKQNILDCVADDKSDLVRRNNELDNIAHDLDYKLQEAINRADADYNEALREGHNDGYQDALKPIRKIYESEKDNIFKTDGEGIKIVLWQAFKTALGEK